jgi:drug/metabolite transporter (DMT)-like permease
MLWLFLVTTSYFLLAVVLLIDKHLLTASLPKPKVYTFYIGISWTFVLLFIPFVNFYIPPAKQIIISLLSGIAFIHGVFWLNKSLLQFEASRVAPAVGAFMPLFTFAIISFLPLEKEVLSHLEIIAFFILILGSLLISLEKGKFINLKSLKISLISAFLFSLSFVLAKYVYLNQKFWNGFIWTKIGGILMAILFFIFSREVREEILKKRQVLPKKNIALFLSNQAIGAISNIFQNWAIAIVPLYYVAMIQALQGMQYAFLLILAALVSFKFPNFLKEEVSRSIIFQKIVAIVLIAMGLMLIAFK